MTTETSASNSPKLGLGGSTWGAGLFVSEGTASVSDDHMPYGTMTERRGAGRAGSTNEPFGTDTSHRERMVEPFDPPDKLYKSSACESGTLGFDSSSSSSRGGGDSVWSTEEDSGDTLENNVRQPATPASPTPIPNSRKTSIFILMLVTQLIANFDSGALASIYGMKPLGDRVVCTSETSSFTCPTPLADGTSYPPTEVSPDVASFLSISQNTTTTGWSCLQATNEVLCNASTWSCSWELGSYVDPITDGTYNCSYKERDDLAQSLLHDPNFDQLYLNKDLQGFLSSIVYLGLSVGAVFTGIGFRYFPPQRLVQGSLVLNVGFAFMFAQSINRGMLFASRFLVGITQATLLVFAPVWVDEFAIQEYASLWMSLIQAAVPLGIVAGYICAGMLAAGTSLKWSWSFYIQCVALAPCVVLQLMIPGEYMNLGQGVSENKEEEEQEMSEDIKEETSGLKVVLSNPVVWLGVLAVTSLYFVVTSMQLWITDYLTTEPTPVDIPGETAADKYSTIVFAFGLTAITGPIAGVLLGGYVLDSPRWVGGYAEHPNKASFFSAVAGCGAAVSAILSLVMTTFWPFIAVTWFTLFFGGMVLPGLTGVIISSVAIEHRGVTSSFAGVMYNLFGYFAGPFVTGLVANEYGLKRGFQVALSWAAVAALLGVLTWVVGLRRKLSGGVTSLDNVYCEGVARVLCGLKVVTAEEDEAPPLLTVTKNDDGEATLMEAEEGRVLPPLVKLLLLLSEYSEDDPLNVVTLPRRRPSMPDVPGVLMERGSVPPEMEPLSEFFNILDVHEMGVVSADGLETALRDKRSLGRRLLHLEGVEGNTVEEISTTFRAKFGLYDSEGLLTWENFLEKGEELKRFMSSWRFKSLPQYYVLAGFQNGTDKHFVLRKSERDGLPFWWGPATPPEDEPTHEQTRRDKQNAQVFLFSMFRGGKRGWMIGTPEDFVLRYHGYFVSAETDKFDLLSAPHRQQNWMFINNVAQTRNWQTTLRVVTMETWSEEVAWKAKEERRPALGATMAAMGISTLFNTRASLAPGKSFIVKKDEKITPAVLLKRLREYFADSAVTKQHAEADVAGLYESRRMSVMKLNSSAATGLAMSSVHLPQQHLTTPTATLNLASPRMLRRRSILRESFRRGPTTPATDFLSPHKTYTPTSTVRTRGGTHHVSFAALPSVDMGEDTEGDE